MTADRDRDVRAPEAALAAAEARAAAAEAALREATLREQTARARLEGFVENIPDIAWESYFEQSPTTRIVDHVSEQILPMSGYTADEWKQPNFWRELVHPTTARTPGRTPSS